MIDHCSFSFAMDEELKVEVLQQHVDPPLLIDYMLNTHFSICQKNRYKIRGMESRSGKADTNRVHHVQLHSKCTKIGLYKRRRLDQFLPCPEQ